MSDNPNPGGLNLPTAENSSVDEALRALLKAISESPGSTENFQLTLNVSGATPAANPALDFTAGNYIRQVFPDAANPGMKKIATTFLPDNPTAEVETDVQPHNPGDKVTWKGLLNDPPGIDIDAGIAILRMDQAVENITITWLPNSEGVPLLRVHRTKSEVSIEGGPIVNLAKFLNCTSANTQMSYPARLAHCLPQLLA